MKNENYLRLNDGTKCWYEKKEGNLCPFVFIHGNAQNHTTGNPIMRFLNEIGHQTLTYDLPGHGRSEPYVENNYSIEKFSDTLRNIIKDISKKPILIGHSMGGIIALKYASQNPNKIAGLVLIGTTDVNPSLVNDMIKFEEVVKQIVGASYKLFMIENKGMTYPFDENPQLSENDVLEMGLKYTVPGDLEGNFSSVLNNYDIRDKTKQIKVPSLIIRGEDDILITEKMAEDMHRRIEKSRLITVKNLGHNFLIQKPDILIKAIKDNYDYLTNNDIIKQVK